MTFVNVLPREGDVDGMWVLLRESWRLWPG